MFRNYHAQFPLFRQLLNMENKGGRIRPFHMPLFHHLNLPFALTNFLNFYPQLIKLNLPCTIFQAKSLAPGGETRQMWEKVPFPITFKVHIFNVTNYLAVQNGDIPMLDEIGPYYFE